MFYLELHKAQNILRDEDGTPYSWRGGKLIKKFRNAVEFLDYVRDHAKELRNAVVFTSSASLIATSNAYLASELKKAGVLK